ncbi:EAL domain-containing protein [Fulvimarina sp. MAC8]|uniref:sensor domain-containing protein n=1 Tax=Fulvimarina sp. MAC8 TaxID=3162874 RepID=UPI0032EFE19A
MLATIFAHTPNQIVLYDENARIIVANPAVIGRFGVAMEDIRGRTPDEIIPHDDMVELRQKIVQAACSGQITTMHFSDRALDETASAPKIRLIPLIAPHSATRRVLAISSHTTDIDELRIAAAEANDRLSAAVKVFFDMFWIKDADGAYVLTNDKFDEFNSLQKKEAIGLRASDLSHGDIRETHRLTDEEALTSQDAVQFEMEIPASDTMRARRYDVRKTAIHDRYGKITGILGTARDITANHEMAEELRARERDYRQLAEHLPDCLIRFERTGRPIYMNGALKRMLKDRFGFSPDNEFAEFMEKPERYPGLVDLRNSVYEVLRTEQPYQKEYVFHFGDDVTITHEIRLFPEFCENRKLISVLGIGRDITDRKTAEQALAEKEHELERLAFTDSLTGLANRAKFRDTLLGEIAAATKSGTRVALFTLDIDHFKAINDSLGHVIGDELLCLFAERLLKQVGQGIWVGRLGGDEFAVIQPGLTDPAQAEALAEKIIKAIAVPMTLDGVSVNVATSIGLAIAPDDSICDATLFRYADIALYKAKASGRGQFCRYTADMNRIAQNRFEMEAMMTRGLALREFSAHFQPKIDLKTGRICGAEALCRWKTPEKGFISPAEFIPIAEETGKIIEIGRRILFDAATFAVACNTKRDEPIVVAVNVSARQFLYGGFLASFGRCLDQTGCKASWLEIEITESILLKDDVTILQTLQTIADLGVVISIDDFGTGYSALSYLHQFPISVLKIDQSFIRQIDHDPKQEVLVKAILAMAQGLGLKTVAEGVERVETERLLTTLGCDQGQGYLWHRPMPAADLLELLNADDEANLGHSTRQKPAYRRAV